MERTAWTDERLDDMSKTMTAGFERLGYETRELRGEVHSLRGELHSEIGSLRGELHSEIGSLRSELHSKIGSVRGDLLGEMSSLRADLGGRIDATQTMMMRFGSGLMVAMAGVIAAVLLQG